MTRDEIIKLVDEDTLIADGFDDAIAGVVFEPKRVLYDTTKVVKILMERHGMSGDEAEEYFEFNVECAYMGPKTPVFAAVTRWSDDDD